MLFRSQVKSTDGKDGYSALQLGYGSRKEARVTKAELGHTNKIEAKPFRVVREIRLADTKSYTAGQTLELGSVFTAKEKVDVIGASKGRGFAGVMKRHNFRGFKRSHGVHEYYRHGGSIGTRLTPGMTLKGKGMPGRMGNSQVTVQAMKVVRVDTERSLLFIKGGVPGPDGGYVLVRKAIKK